MTTAKWIIFTIAASATSSYVTLYFNQPNQNKFDAASGIENSSHLKSPDSNATEQYQELSKTKKTTCDAHENCEISLNQTAHQVDINSNNTNQIQSTKIEDLQLAYEKKQNEIASFREFTEKTGDGALSVVSNNYNSEPLDPEWARSKEDELLAILDTNETLQNIAPLELSCKSQNCRLILSAHDGTQGESLYSAFKNEALKGNDENKKQVISYFSNPASDEIHIYLSKSTVSTLLDGKMD